MSKPLCFFLEIVGGITLIGGIASPNPGAIIIGSILFLWGAWGIRKRIKGGR